MSREIIDLTKVMDGSLKIYSEAEYSDPALLLEPWCTVPSQGYNVSRMSFGTQTGTHLDAPAHFAENGVTLEHLPVTNMLGAYFYVDLFDFAAQPATENEFSDFRGESILFLFSGERSVQLSREQMGRLFTLGCQLWILAGAMEIPGEAVYSSYRIISEQGLFLVDNVDLEAAQRVRPGGEIVALPLRLTGMSGSPCRVVVLQ